MTWLYLSDTDFGPGLQNCKQYISVALNSEVCGDFCYSSWETITDFPAGSGKRL